MTSNETMHVSSAELLDSDLRAALEAIPSFEVSAKTLAKIRQEIVAQPVPAPPAPGVAMEERFIASPDDHNVRFLIFTPTQKRRPGAVLWIHGGGMIMAAPDGNAPLCRYLAHATGSVVVAVQYRLAPEHPHPAGLDDCYAVLRWMGNAGHEFGYPTDRLIVAGESGGGCLAAGVALLARDRGEVGPVGQILLYPMLDDRTGTASDPDPLPHTGEFVWTRASNRFAWAAVLGQDPGGPSVSAYAAPARAGDLSGVASTTIIVGDLDLFLGDALRYAAKLTASAVPLSLHVYPGAYHGFVTLAPNAPVSQAAFAVFVEAIQSHLR